MILYVDTHVDIQTFKFLELCITENMNKYTCSRMFGRGTARDSGALSGQNLQSGCFAIVTKM